MKKKCHSCTHQSKRTPSKHLKMVPSKGVKGSPLPFHLCKFLHTKDSTCNSIVMFLKLKFLSFLNHPKEFSYNFLFVTITIILDLEPHGPSSSMFCLQFSEHSEQGRTCDGWQEDFTKQARHQESQIQESHTYNIYHPNKHAE